MPLGTRKGRGSLFKWLPWGSPCPHCVISESFEGGICPAFSVKECNTVSRPFSAPPGAVSEPRAGSGRSSRCSPGLSDVDLSTTAPESVVRFRCRTTDSMSSSQITKSPRKGFQWSKHVPHGGNPSSFPRILRSRFATAALAIRGDRLGGSWVDEETSLSRCLIGTRPVASAGAAGAAPAGASISPLPLGNFT